MSSYHSKLGESLESNVEESCGCALMAFKTDIRGSSPSFVGNGVDIIDEMIAFFRANVLFKNFEVKSGADRTLIYMTLYFQQCLVVCEKAQTAEAAKKDLHNLAIKPFSIPGENNWPLGSVFPSAKSKTEADAFRAYFKHAREEISSRIIPLLYVGDKKEKNKWWQSFSKKKFMGKELRD